MTDADSFAQRLERAKLDALKELAYGASHEINNPLANISARAQALSREERNPERRRALEAIHQQALRAHEMISDLMLFARPPGLDLQPTDVPAIVQDVVAELQPECDRRDILIAWQGGPDLPTVAADPVQLAVAIKALCQNSIDAIGRGGNINLLGELRSSPVNSEEATSTFCLQASDDGPGISNAVRPHIFDPFFSGREAGRGLGFGLSKAWRIVQQHGGRLWVDEKYVAGARFVMELPLLASVG
jgi:signal transduction histidine kinase